MRRLLPIGLVVCAALAATPGCKRDADAPIPPSTLFPSGQQAQGAAATTPFGAIVRAPVVAEHEPNDTAATAQQLADDTLIKGTLGAAGDVPGAVDWFAIAGRAAVDEALRIELRGAPACAELALFRPGDAEPSQTTSVSHGAAVLTSLAADTRGWHVRLRCLQKRRKRAAVGGAYELAVQRYRRGDNEEREPNDKHDEWTRELHPGPAWTGTLAHAGDVDVMLLAPGAGGDGEVLTLTVAGLPGVALHVSIIDAEQRTVLLRQTAVGAGVTVRNLDARLIGAGALLKVSAAKGHSATHAYALQLQQAPAVGLQLHEREPNDDRAQAVRALLGRPVDGLLEDGGDQDWYAISVTPGSIIGAHIAATPGLAPELTLAVAGRPIRSIGGKNGAKVTIDRFEVPGDTLFVRVGGELAKDTTSARYRLDTVDVGALEAALELPGSPTPDLAAPVTPPSSPLP